MLIRLLSGDIISIKDLFYDYSEYNEYNYNNKDNKEIEEDDEDVQRHIFNCLKSNELVDLFLPVQLEYKKDNEGIINVFINDLESIDPDIVLRNIDLYDQNYDIRQEKLEKYIQYLCDKNYVDLEFSKNKYYILYIKFKIVSRVWDSPFHQPKSEFLNEDDMDEIIKKCKNIPIRIGANIYRINFTIHKSLIYRLI